MSETVLAGFALVGQIQAGSHWSLFVANGLLTYVIIARRPYVIRDAAD